MQHSNLSDPCFERSLSLTVSENVLTRYRWFTCLWIQLCCHIILIVWYCKAAIIIKFSLVIGDVMLILSQCTGTENTCCGPYGSPFIRVGGHEQLSSVWLNENELLQLSEEPEGSVTSSCPRPPGPGEETVGLYKQTSSHQAEPCLMTRNMG